MARWGNKKVNLQKRRVVFFSFLIMILLFLQGFIVFENRLQPILMNIAKARVKQIATNAVNDAISKKIAQNSNFRDLIQFETDQQGKIRAAVFNSAEFARIVGETTERVENTMNDLNKIIEPIKFGAALNSELLSEMGPTIPITIVPIGHVQVSPVPELQNVGINVVVMTVLLEIHAEVQVVIPFIQEPEVIVSRIPIAQTQIFGEVPQFYYNGNPLNSTGSGPQAVPIIPWSPVAPSNGTTINPAAPSSSLPTVPTNSSSSVVEPIPGFESFYPIINDSGQLYQNVAQ